MISKQMTITLSINGLEQAHVTHTALRKGSGLALLRETPSELADTSILGLKTSDVGGLEVEKVRKRLSLVNRPWYVPRQSPSWPPWSASDLGKMQTTNSSRRTHMLVCYCLRVT